MTISAVRIRLIREALQLSAREFGSLVVQDPGENVDRTVRAWESGKDHPGSESVRRIYELEEEMLDLVDQWVSDLEQTESSERVIVTFRNNKQLHQALPHVERPAAWHRALVNQIRYSLEDVQVLYYGDPESGPYDYWPTVSLRVDDFAYINANS